MKCYRFPDRYQIRNIRGYGKTCLSGGYDGSVVCKYWRCPWMDLFLHCYRRRKRMFRQENGCPTCEGMFLNCNLRSKKQPIVKMLPFLSFSYLTGTMVVRVSTCTEIKYNVFNFKTTNFHFLEENRIILVIQTTICPCRR